ncbi:MAG: hypothetical protein JXA67_00825 [Micromonosporaceae bacterium]|nr:hypothetical protein [Micromonosporaceae bacterium]
MPEVFTVALPARYGSLTVVEDIDVATGLVRYAVSGRRISGVFVIEPETRRDEAVPTRICIRYGDGPQGYHRDEDRTDRPVLNGTVDLVGATVIDPDSDEPLTRWRLNIRRPTGRYTSATVPDKTGDHAAAVINALVQRWRTHPARQELMLAAARRTAERRIAEIRRWDLQPRYQQRDELVAEIDHYEVLVEQLGQLGGPAHDTPQQAA